MFKTELNGLEVNITPQGTIRWLGKWFTHYKMPADFLLLDDDQYELTLELRKERNLPLQKRKGH
tara:strand:- start:663 stop:854 length:192 start_codon:yes stop_codon:yes gene_type:complete